MDAFLEFSEWNDHVMREDLAYRFGCRLACRGSAQSVGPGEEHCVVNVRTDDWLKRPFVWQSQGPCVARKRYRDCGIVVTGPCSGAWCPIEDGHFKGWVRRRFISMVSPARYCGTGVEDALNLRVWSSARSRVLIQLPPNQCEIASSRIQHAGGRRFG
jgi:hypothetical protein